MADTFEERARELIAFLVERQGAQGAGRAREQELAEWIDRRRQDGSPAHFVGPELGIILRALSGPDPAGHHALDPDHQQVCWLIAKRMNHDDAVTSR